MKSLSAFDLSRLEHQSILTGLAEAQQFLRGRVLDVGCGNQPYAPLVLRQASTYVGIDLSCAHDPAPHVCGDSLQLPFKDASFDAVLSTQVIEHVTDPFVMVKEIGRVVRPGGYAVITGPFAWPLHEEPHDYFRFTKYAFAQLAARGGLSVVSIRERGGTIMALTQLLAALAYDRCKGRRLSRWLVKGFGVPMLACSALVDRMVHGTKFTLGYVMVCQRLDRAAESI
jgi:SAM-dependent methyltransferase